MEDDVDQKILGKLEEIRVLLQLQARDSIIKEIRRVASTIERRKMWELCDGSNSTSDIAAKTGRSLRAVQYFVKDGEMAGVITQLSRGLPKRAFDFDIDWEGE